MTSYAALPRVHDHRVREFICLSGDPNLFPKLDIQRSTAAGWIRDGPRDVVTAEVFTMSDNDLRLEVQKLRERAETITAVLASFLPCCVCSMCAPIANGCRRVKPRRRCCMPLTAP